MPANNGFTKKQVQELTQIVDSALDKGFSPKQKQELDLVFEAKLKPVKKDLRKIKSDLKRVINHFDKRLINRDIRLEKVEKHIGIFQESI